MTDYCGCCGRPSIGEWCSDCLPHLLPRGREPWARTYSAQHGHDCPFTPHFHSDACYAMGPGDTEVLVCGTRRPL